METTEKLLGDIIRSFVSYPEEVETHCTYEKDDRGDFVVINVKLNKSDIGICIGKKGETAEALRKIIGVVGYRQSESRVYVKIDAPKLPPNHFEY
jgi:predicted RNA-binding protein YlqC (UPF0109 family)